MKFEDIKPEAQEAKERTIEWQKLIHVVTTLILEENQKQRLANQSDTVKLNYGHCGDAAELFKLLSRAAIWVGVEPQQVEELAKQLK